MQLEKNKTNLQDKEDPLQNNLNNLINKIQIKISQIIKIFKKII